MTVSQSGQNSRSKEGVYFYGRVSTHDQDLGVQQDYAKDLGILEENQVYEKKSGGKLEGRVLEELLDRLEPGDSLHALKLDRLGRSTSDILKIVQACRDKGVSVHLGDLGTIDDSPTGQLILTIFGAFSQFERDLITERMQAGKVYQRKHNPGFKEGRPRKLTQMQVDYARQKIDEGIPAKEVATGLGVSDRTLRRYLNEY